MLLSCLVLLFISANAGVVGVTRTPMGGFLGSLSSLPATKLRSIAISNKIRNFSSIYQFTQTFLLSINCFVLDGNLICWCFLVFDKDERG